jgi:solute carrier family 25 folate transporter 32
MQLQMKKTTELMSQTGGTKIVHYNGFLDALRKIVHHEGFFALYKGTGPALLLTSHGGVQFVVYEFLRKHFHYTRAQQQRQQQQSLSSSSSSSTTVIQRFEDSLGYLTIGAISKMVASTVTYPFQVVKSRMQQPSNSIELTSSGDVRVVQRDYKGLFATIHKIWKREGLPGFFKGAIPNALRVAPSAAVTFLVYETVMDVLK